MCSTGILQGVIEEGDYEKVKYLLHQNYPFLKAFVLISPGGSVDEAIRIGKLFRKYLTTVHTQIRGGEERFGPIPACKGQDCSCASACALIWFGAVSRTGTVGLHRPRIDDPQFKDLPPDEASKNYRAVLSRIADYMFQMEAPQPMVDAMVATGSADIHWVGSTSDRLDEPPSFTEWVSASCGSVGESEHQKYMELYIKNIRERLTETESPLLEMISEKIDQHAKCQMRLVFAAIERLGSP